MGISNHSHRHGTAGHSVEFAELLDPIRSTAARSGALTAGRSVAESTIEPVSEPDADDLPLIEDDAAEPPTSEAISDRLPHESPDRVVAPSEASRFADAGMDDDRLPLATKGRRHRR